MEISNITEMTKIKRHRYIKFVCPSVRSTDHSSAPETGILASFYDLSGYILSHHHSIMHVRNAIIKIV